MAKINIDINAIIDIDKLKQDAIKEIDESIIKELEEIDTSDEPLIQPNPDMFSLNEMTASEKAEFEQYKLQQKSYWPAEEVSMADDIKDWDNILYDQTSSGLSAEERADNKRKNDNVRYFIMMTLAFFASADGIVNANLNRFITEITNPYVRLYYTFQMMMENIHSESYAIMLKTLVPDPLLLKNLFRAIYYLPVIRKKAIFALKYIEHPDPKHYINSPISIGLRLVATACTELIQFSSSFASIYWIRAATNGKMVGLCQYNKQIAKDESSHGVHHAELYNREIKHRLPVSIVYKILTEAYNFEKDFFYESLPVALIGINADEMDIYVRMTTIRLSEMLGYPPVFTPVKNPFPFMEKINLNAKDNLHEVASGEYQNALSKDSFNWGVNMNF
jgi:ribonucleotide reductase beta subunit family protein with ferritin-like domain